MTNDPKAAIDEAAVIIGKLISVLPDRDLNCVREGIAWLVTNAPDDLWLRATVRDMMEGRK